MRPTSWKSVSGRTTPAACARSISAFPAPASAVRQASRTFESGAASSSASLSARFVAAKPTYWCSQRESASHGGRPARSLRRPRHRLHLVDVDRLEERLARREVPVERPDPHAGPLGHVLERRGRPDLGERRARGSDELVVVAARVGPLGALELLDARLSVSSGSVWSRASRLTNGGYLRIVTGGSLQIYVEASSILAPNPPERRRAAACRRRNAHCSRSCSRAT